MMEMKKIINPLSMDVDSWMERNEYEPTHDPFTNKRITTVALDDGNAEDYQSPVNGCRLMDGT